MATIQKKPKATGSAFAEELDARLGEDTDRLDLDQLAARLVAQALGESHGPRLETVAVAEIMRRLGASSFDLFEAIRVTTRWRDVEFGVAKAAQADARREVLLAREAELAPRERELEDVVRELTGIRAELSSCGAWDSWRDKQHALARAFPESAALPAPKER